MYVSHQCLSSSIRGNGLAKQAQKLREQAEEAKAKAAKAAGKPASHYPIIVITTAKNNDNTIINS